MYLQDLLVICMSLILDVAFSRDILEGDISVGLHATSGELARSLW